ncbi:MAG: 30S ribosomal protein S18 [Candidatus Komeilibacteria bacterium CG11_big_fil_rev_8_21_14_0_20_36_20]|uniref:Small ribosomal subunit protein bS18 n=1 Tax=Candidatus Komeilibacteria bacterium CG11_big_fil_rev_8_21_14_0_20_36_20 TaxID=1974477 RepID=A0A2H0NCT5_9BACT|nr:MAG: 30S ribosomal protein S18 [Candidatus Komeilibacteria bacterium CG11_big_fil_rev_8_21_14_0_20_36_20]PIR81504.1 MAG: 30S ribosomal protein S18 [Candidatus Komeilibacteria bacterium CG10_big_fil_rev_8_21_14_0_10_36_65]PJC55720.1 MAG: 30S ribosomal protein S18 [Candidatus Komeilibacteria bacterium CG_4_9_14_0_2_um_filter_36_13]
MHKKHKSKYCHFCVNQIDEIDYKDWQQLKRFTSSYGKIVPKRRSGVCSKHQRTLAGAIKRARFMALLPYISQ